MLAVLRDLTHLAASMPVLLVILPAFSMRSRPCPHVPFTSYGCGDERNGTGVYSNVASNCLGKQSCSVSAHWEQYQPDPCPGTGKCLKFR